MGKSLEKTFAGQRAMLKSSRFKVHLFMSTDRMPISFSLLSLLR